MLETGVFIKRFIVILITINILPVKAQSDSTIIKVIASEAKELRKNKKAFKKYVKKEDSLYSIRERDVKRNMHVFFSPDLTVLNAPLSYFFIRLEGEYKGYHRCHAYLEAIAVSQDIEKRQAFIDYIRTNGIGKCAFDQDLEWNRLKASSAAPEWANDFISHQLDSIHIEPFDAYYFHESLAGLVILKNVEWLTPKNKEKAYNYLKQVYDGPPENGDPEYFFRLLYRIKPEETQNELVHYLYSKRINFYALLLLADFRRKNKHAGQKLIQFRTNCHDSTSICRNIRNYLNTAIYFTDSVQGIKDVLLALKEETKGNRSFEESYLDPEEVIVDFINYRYQTPLHMNVVSEYIASKTIDTFGDLTRRYALKVLKERYPKDYKTILDKLKATRKTKNR